MKIQKAIVAAIAAAVSAATPAQSWEDATFAALVNREMTFFGVDADVRRLLNDADFENDLRKWWTVVNPFYVEDALRGQYEDEPNPSAAEMRAWAQRSNLKGNNASQYRMRVLFANHMDRALPSEKTQIYLAYFLRTGQKDKARSLLRIYAQEYALFAREVLEDPRFASGNAAAVQALRAAAALVDTAGTSYKRCMAETDLGRRGDCLVWNSVSPKVREFAACADAWNGVESVPQLARCLESKISFRVGGRDVVSALGYDGPAHLVSRTGFLGGNDVRYFTENRHDASVVRHFESLYQGSRDPVADAPGSKLVSELERIFQQGALPFSSPLFPEADRHEAFRETQYVPRARAIFPEILDAIRSAKHTIFVDVFFFGGTMGVALAKELIRKAESGVKVYFLKDPYNAFAYGKEIEPVFNMMIAYSNQNPDRMVAAGSYIFAHRTGLPRYFDALVPDPVMDALVRRARETFNFTAPLFPKAKSDHSKVLVIDGAGLWPDSVPVAYVGSKNWTDSSGAMTFDEVARVTGPAAVAIQDSYYWDFWYALRGGGHGRRALHSAAIEIHLEEFDPLKRRWDERKNRAVPTRAGLVNVGARQPNLKVRLGQNNIDSSETSALDQDVLAIRRAKKQIVINDQFLYDRRIVEEILDKAASNPGVRIYIMLEPISKSSGKLPEPMGGFPNTLYADLLTYKTVETDARGRVTKKVRWPNIFLKWKHVPHSDEFHMEYHMKTISVDGFGADGKRVAGGGKPVLITGSANKDHMTMHGAFREMQVEIWDDRPCSGQGEAAVCGAVAEADRIFWKRWNNRASPDEGGGSEEADPFKFTLYPQLQQVMRKALGRDMTPAEFLMFARSMVHGAYDLESSASVE